MANKYDIVNGLSSLKFHDWAINSLATDADMSRGRWVMQNASQEAVKSGASPILLPASVYRPIWSGREKPDSQETGLVTTVYGEHEAITDEFETTPSGGRPGWAVNLPIVAVDGQLTTYLAGTDNEEAILGHVVIPPDANGDLRVHITS